MTVATELTLDLLNQLAAWGDSEACQEQLLLYQQAGQSDTICSHLLRGRFAIPERSREAVILGLGHAHREVRTTALELAVKLADETLLPDLAPRLEDEAKSVREDTRRAILACRSQNPTLLAPILERLPNYEALQALAYPNNVPQVLAALLKVLDGTIETARVLAAQALVHCLDHETVAREMRARLSNPAVALCALQVLGHIGSAEDLRPYLDHAETDFQKAAALGLARCGTLEDRQRLRDLWKKLQGAGGLA